MVVFSMLEEIVKTLQEDYAGTMTDTESALKSLKMAGLLESQHLLEEDMLIGMMRILLSSQGLHGVRLGISGRGTAPETTRGFSARGDKSGLFVDEVFGESRLQPGDRILALSGQSPAAYRSQLLQKNCCADFGSADPWRAFLNFAPTIRFENKDGRQETLKLQKFPLKAASPQFEIRVLSENILYGRMDTADDTAEFLRFQKEFVKKAQAASGCILDLRHFKEGSFSSFSPFISLFCEKPVSFSDFWQEEGSYVKYTEASTDRWVGQLKVLGRENDADPEIQNMIRFLIREAEEKRGKGWTPEAPEEADPEEIVPVCSGKKIAILTDRNTRAEGEWFAEKAAAYPGVTVIGRETSGDLNFCMPVTMDLKFGVRMIYPMARTKQSFETGREGGLKPDLPVSWTKEECVRDMILQCAREFLCS